MNVLKDNYSIYKEEPIKKNNEILICEHCQSELEYEESDIRIGEFGAGYVDCPLCGYGNILDEEKFHLVLTQDNIKFPEHFWHTSEKTGAVDICNEENVKKYIKEAIKYFRENKDEYTWGHWITGNLLMFVIRWSGDEIYEIYVSNDFYNTEIPFEKEDY